MGDRIVLRNMVFEGRHGWSDEERENPQPFEVDLELRLDLRPAGSSDDLERTVDYARVFEAAAPIVEARSFRLLEALAEAIAAEVLARFPLVDEVGVRVRKAQVDLGGILDWAGVEIHRGRSA